MIDQVDQDFLSLDPDPLPTDHSIHTCHKRISQVLPNDSEKLVVKDADDSEKFTLWL